MLWLWYNVEAQKILSGVIANEHLPPTWRVLLVALLLGTSIGFFIMARPIEGAGAAGAALYLCRFWFDERKVKALLPLK